MRANLIIVSVALAGNSARPLVDLLVNVEQIFGYQVQDMRQERCLHLISHAKRERLAFDSPSLAEL